MRFLTRFRKYLIPLALMLSVTVFQSCSEDAKDKLNVPGVIADALAAQGLSLPQSENEFNTKNGLQTPLGMKYVTGVSLSSAAVDKLATGQNFEIPIEYQIPGGKKIFIPVGDYGNSMLLMTKVVDFKGKNYLVFVNIAIIGENAQGMRVIRSDTETAKAMSSSLQIKGAGDYAIYFAKEAITFVSGKISMGEEAASGVVITSSANPFLSQTAADGTYTLVASNEPATILAYSEASDTTGVLAIDLTPDTAPAGDIAAKTVCRACGIEDIDQEAAVLPEIQNVNETPKQVTDANISLTSPTDRDNDGIADEAPDNCPTVPNKDQKNDKGGSIMGDACEDQDNDGIVDADDICVTQAQQRCPANDPDSDLVYGSKDNCPDIANADQGDFNNDGVGDACSNSDSDDLLDSVDNCPELANADQADLDKDGVGDACDDDTDGDLIANGSDNCPAIVNTDQLDTDGDGRGDACDDDIDGDSIANADDLCPLDKTNICPAGDPDGDGIPTMESSAPKDNCPTVANADQKNLVHPATFAGDACEDADSDTIVDASDNCPDVANADQLDSDADGQGNACDTDDDGDGLADASDNCPLFASADQTDTDGDGLGDGCDGDDDGDQVDDISDNCPMVSNSDQSNQVHPNTALGDACEDGDSDGIMDSVDTCPDVVNTGADANANGVDDACDGGFNANLDVETCTLFNWTATGNVKVVNNNPENTIASTEKCSIWLSTASLNTDIDVQESFAKRMVEIPASAKRMFISYVFHSDPIGNLSGQRSDMFSAGVVIDGVPKILFKNNIEKYSYLESGYASETNSVDSLNGGKYQNRSGLITAKINITEYAGKQIAISLGVQDVASTKGDTVVVVDSIRFDDSEEPPVGGSVVSISQIRESEKGLTVGWKPGTDDISETGKLQYQVVMGDSEEIVSKLKTDNTGLENSATVLMDWKADVYSVELKDLPGGETKVINVLVKDEAGLVGVYNAGKFYIPVFNAGEGLVFHVPFDGRSYNETATGAGKINIVSAIYGAQKIGGRSCDATNYIKNICNDKQSCNVISHNGMCGDPHWGIVKDNEVTYNCGAQTNNIRISAREWGRPVPIACNQLVGKPSGMHWNGRKSRDESDAGWFTNPGRNSYVDYGRPLEVEKFEEMTVAIWARKLGNYWQSGHLLNQGGGWGDDGFSLFWYGNRIRIELQNTSRRWKTINDFGAPSYGQWHHIAFTWKKADGRIRCYIDGNEQKMIHYEQGPRDFSINIGKPYQNLLIGKNERMWNGFDGFLDDARIYNKALTGDEMQKLYESIK